MFSSLPIRVLVLGQLFSLVMSCMCCAASPSRLGVLVSEKDYSAFQLVGPDAGKVTVTEQPFDGPGIGKVLRIETREACSSSYAAQWSARNSRPVQKDDVLVLRFYLRTIKSELESQEGQTEVVVEDAATYDKILQFGATALDGWKEHLIPFVATADFPSGKAAINFRVGYQPQIIEIAGLTITNFGPREKLSEAAAGGARLDYAGLAPDAPWRAAATERIEKFRKGDLKITVQDENGNPVPEARVSIAQTRHAYWFGSAVRSDRLVQPGKPDEEKAYREAVRGFFNAVTFENDLKWPFWQRNFPATEASIAWLHEEGIALRGHALVWGSRKKGLPESEYGLTENPARLRQAILDHIREILGKVKPPAAAWDVLNEAFNHHEFMDLLGDEAMGEWFRAAREASPSSLLFINDWGIVTSRGRDTRHQDAYAKTIAHLIDGQAPLDGIGMQGHFGRELTDPEQMLRVLDRFGAFGKEIQMTEYSSQFSDPEDAAVYLRDCLTVFFSHPSTSGFILWGFQEGVGMPNKSFLMDKTGRLTPSGQTWQDLIFREWWTKATAMSDLQGQVASRGFFGEYRIIADKDGLTGSTTVQLDRSGASATVVLRAGPHTSAEIRTEAGRLASRQAP